MSLRLRAVKTATTYRPTVVAGKRTPSTAPAHLSDLSCTPLVAADVGRLGALVEAQVIQSVLNVYETVVLGAGLDIIAGDLLEVDSVRYVVRAVASWVRPVDACTHVTVERILQ